MKAIVIFQVRAPNLEVTIAHCGFGRLCVRLVATLQLRSGLGCRSEPSTPI